MKIEDIINELNKKEQFAAKGGVLCDLTVIKGTDNKNKENNEG